MPEALAGGWKAPGRARHGLPCRATASGKSPFCGAFRKKGRRPRAINGCGSSSIAWPITTSPMHHKACGACPERASGSGKPNFPAPGAAVTALFPVLITFPRLPPGAIGTQIFLTVRGRPGTMSTTMAWPTGAGVALQRRFLAGDAEKIVTAGCSMGAARHGARRHCGGGLSSMYAGLANLIGGHCAVLTNFSMARGTRWKNRVRLTIRSSPVWCSAITQRNTACGSMPTLSQTDGRWRSARQRMRNAMNGWRSTGRIFGRYRLATH